MKVETITQRVLTAEEGMFLTDGNTFGKTVVLPANADYSVWQEVTQTEKEAREQAEIPERVL